MKPVQKLCLTLAAAVGLGGFALIPSRVSAAELIIHIGAEAPAPTPVVYHYQYYPDDEVYFVPETHVYWWSDHGTWRSGPAVPAGITLGTSVNIGVDGRDPWRHHEVIVKEYPRHKHEDRHDDRH